MAVKTRPHPGPYVRRSHRLQDAMRRVLNELEPGLDVAYHFGARKLNVHFFQPGELYDNPSVPGRMNTLRTHHAVHGGYIKIQEHGEDRQGWNLVLVRRRDAEVGQWLVVDTDFHALNGRYARYPPFATQARVFADNLACHWDNMMHVYVLEDRPLEAGRHRENLGGAIPKHLTPGEG